MARRRGGKTPLLTALLSLSSLASFASLTPPAASSSSASASCSGHEAVEEADVEFVEDSEISALELRLLQSHISLGARATTGNGQRQIEASTAAATATETATEAAAETAAAAAAADANGIRPVDSNVAGSLSPKLPFSKEASAHKEEGEDDFSSSSFIQSSVQIKVRNGDEGGDPSDGGGSDAKDGETEDEKNATTEVVYNSELIGKVCMEAGHCCPFETSTKGSVCGLFCKEGTEIDKTDVKGWRLKGECAKKWVGWCLEDEDCRYSYYCERGEHSLSGTCTRDELCDNVTCGRGKCRKGTCTCDFGVTGPLCDRSTEAFAFLFYGNSSENLISTRVLIRSLRSAGGAQDIVAIIPKNLANGTPTEHLSILEQDGIKLYYTDPILMPESMDKDPIIHQRWSGVMNKFAVWRLEEYSQVALVDTDMVFSFDSESPDALFDECTAPVCAVRDNDPRYMNAGVLVITPSIQRLDHIMQVLHNEQHHFSMPEQSFLTVYCKNPRNKMKLQYLDRKWNSCVGGGMLHNIGWESSGYNVLHSCSWQGKPPTLQMCFPGKCDMEQEWHTVLAWQFFHMQVDSCIMKQSQVDCGRTGIGKCHWCGHYCGDARIACESKLFNQSKKADDEEPDWKKASALEPLKEGSGREWLEAAKKSAAWDQLPLGSWAWPQVAMYQILIDRFEAQPAAAPCTKMDDYCGGNFAGIRSKLGYLSRLGVDGVLVSPVIEQMPHGYHGYWPKNLTKVNPQYGTEDELRELVVLMHEQKMKAVIDINLNHAGGPKINASNPDDVAQLYPFNKTEYYHSENCSLIHNADYDRGAHFLERCKLYGLPDYDHENPEVWRRLQEFVREHVDSYGFDGIRVDAARHISKPFLDHIPESGPPIPSFYEVVNGQLSYITGYANGDYSAVYNYPLYYTLVNIFVPNPMQAPMSDLAKWMEDEGPKAQGRLLLNFLENNDLPRFVYKLDGDLVLYHNALLCILGMEGLPVLLYGGEQNARGILDYNDPLRVDNWRPALWDVGFDESTSTYQMIQKVLWVRKELNGMHSFRQQAVYSDHSVVIFTRGPVIFAVTNVGSNRRIRSQRVIWDNETNSDGTKNAFSEPTWVCNLLAVSPKDDCGIVSPKNISRLHLTGEPKMYVPFAFVAEYEASLKKEAELEEVIAEGITDLPDVVVKPFSDWPTIPTPPAYHVESQQRTPRSYKKANVVITENQKRIWHAWPQLPPHLDLWSPPVGQPATHLITASAANACFSLGAGEEDGLLYMKQNGTSYVLCPDSADWCPDVLAKANFSEMKMASENSPMQPTPVLFATYDMWYGVYHELVAVVPTLMPHLDRLRDGSMKVFFHSGEETVKPYLELLGIKDAAFFATSANESYHFCAPEILFSFSTRPLYPRIEYVANYLHSFRAAIKVAPAGIQTASIEDDASTALTSSSSSSSSTPPCPALRDAIVVLSRGNGSRSILNEADLVTALSTLGRPVHVVLPTPGRMLDVLSVLKTAVVLVGGHGANLVNMMFAPPETKVVEIVPQVVFPLEDYHFRELAGALNFSYVAIGQQIPVEDYDQSKISNPMTMDKALPSYAVDVEAVKSTVASLLES